MSSFAKSKIKKHTSSFCLMLNRSQKNKVMVKGFQKKKIKLKKSSKFLTLLKVEKNPKELYLKKNLYNYSSGFRILWHLLKKSYKTKTMKTQINATKILNNLDKLMSIEYSLDNYHRSNQDTCLVHKPSVFEGQWVQSGDLLADCSASIGGELSLGQNILIAYMPWEGYNFEDAILISERLVYDDLYTSIHIERYELEIRETKLGVEEVTRDIPDVPPESLNHLHRSGIAKLGSWVEEGDILVGKVTPVNKKKQSNYQKLLYTILEKPVLPVRDSSLRAPKGIKAKVVGIQIFKNNKKYSTVALKPKKESTQVSLSSLGLLTLPASQKKTSISLTGKKKQKTLKLTKEKLNKKESLEGKQYSILNQQNKLKSETPWKLNIKNQALTDLSLKNPLKLGNENKNNNFKSPKIKKAVLPNFNKSKVLSKIDHFNSINSLHSGQSQFKNLNKSYFSSNSFLELYNNIKPIFPETNSLYGEKPLLSFSFFKRKELKKVKKFDIKFNYKENQNTIKSAAFQNSTDKIIFDDLPSFNYCLETSLYGSKLFINLKTIYKNKKYSTSFLYLQGLKSPPFNKNKSSKQKEISSIIENEKSTNRDEREKKNNSYLKSKKQTYLNSNPFISNIIRKKKTISPKNPFNKNNLRAVQIYLAEKRRIQVGDKMAGRHGNKGIISQILPREDMPFLPDGTPLDMVLNPLGVPSRMNVGQIYECLLGLAGKHLGENFKIFPFDEIYGAEASRSFVFSKLYDARIKTGKFWLFNQNSPGKIRLYDGRTGDCFDQAITVGYAYMLRLVHMVDDKIHCLTPDHDVLTTKGWIPIEQIKHTHKIAILQKGQLKYKNPENIFAYPDFNGNLYHIKNADLDLKVTLNHRMYVKSGTILDQSFESYELLEAQQIISEHKRYLKNANWTKPDYQIFLPAITFAFNMSEWLLLFGLWITEGFVCNDLVKTSLAKSNKDFIEIIPRKIEKLVDNTLNKIIEMKKNQFNFNQTSEMIDCYPVVISHKNESVRAIIFNILKKLGYKYKIVNNKIVINNKHLWHFLKPLSLDTTDKFLPSWVWELSQKQARLLLHGMILGNGTLRKATYCYYTSSRKLADDVMRLALHAGWSANKSLFIPVCSQDKLNKLPEVILQNQDLIMDSPIWRLSIRKIKNSPAVNNAHGRKQNNQKEEVLPYQGPVYCLSVPSEIFYVRRNGLPVWTGNSRSTGPYSLVTQQPLRGRSKQGGQRLGEMEVWALEGYGAAFTLLEMLTIKSDDMTGRMTLWSNLILNKEISIGTPESFKVLICELQALCLDIGLFRVT